MVEGDLCLKHLNIDLAAKVATEHILIICWSRLKSLVTKIPRPFSTKVSNVNPIDAILMFIL
jgi:hypothetical protein